MVVRRFSIAAADDLRGLLSLAAYTEIVSQPLGLPLLRWDGLHLAVSLPLLERHLEGYLGPSSNLQHPVLGGEGDTLRLGATVRWRGVKVRVVLELAEFRLKHRRLGFRVQRVRTFGRLSLPRVGVEALLRAVAPSVVTVVRGQGIVLVDLRQWIPPNANLSLLTLQATEQSLHLWFGAGDLRDLPQPSPRALPAQSQDAPAAAGRDDVTTVGSSESGLAPGRGDQRRVKAGGGGDPP